METIVKNPRSHRIKTQTAPLNNKKSDHKNRPEVKPDHKLPQQPAALLAKTQNEEDPSIRTPDHSWESMYHNYEAFLQDNPQAHPSSDPDQHILADWLNRQIVNKRHLSEDQFHRLDSLGVNWDTPLSRDHAWEIMITRLEAFHKEFGHCRVPYQWPRDRQLALWVLRQRKMNSNGKILEYRKRILNELGFTWQAQELYDHQWDQGFRELKTFYREHGHYRVPGTEKRLVGWIERQRLSRKKKQLSPERQARLNEVNFIWDFDDIKKNDWKGKYRQLSAFHKKYGHSFVPVNFKENRSLGIWVASQRKAETEGRLSKSRFEKLDKLGFVWSGNTQDRLKADYDYQWERSFEQLRTYCELHGTCQVSLKSMPRLQSWTVWQRKMFYAGKLSSGRIAKLNEISFPWNVNEGYWLRMFGMLLTFHDRFGHSRVPSQWTENPRLSAWTYRVRLSKHKLSEDKINLLDKLGFEWNVKRKTIVGWSAMYQRLLAFKQEYGHTRVPVEWREDAKLGKWVSRIRSEREKITAERLALLEEIGFDWEPRIKRRRSDLYTL